MRLILSPPHTATPGAPRVLALRAQPVRAALSLLAAWPPMTLRMGNVMLSMASAPTYTDADLVTPQEAGADWAAAFLTTGD